MRLLLLFFSFIFLSSSSASSLATGSGILEILIESGAPTDVNFIVTFDNESHVTWRHLEPNIPELLIFDEFNHTSFFHRINVTIHDNVTSHSTITYTFQGLYDIDDLPVPYTGLQIKFKCAENRYGLSCQQPCTDPRGNWRCDQFGQHSCAEGYCGWNCHKFGSECHRFGECKCQNGGKCYPHPILLQHLVMCECPPAAKLWILICMVAMAGYCIYKFCGESKNEKKILETSGDKKKTSEEEKKCILIEMNDM